MKSEVKNLTIHNNTQWDADLAKILEPSIDGIVNALIAMLFVSHVDSKPNPQD